MCDPYNVTKKWNNVGPTTKIIFFVNTKKERKALIVKPKFLYSIFTHYIQNSRLSANDFIKLKRLSNVRVVYYKQMAAGRAKILAIGASGKLRTQLCAP